MSEERAGRCWYCGEAKLRTDDPAEHIIPNALGGTLKTDRVCRDCNQRAGSEIDWPLQNDWLIAQAQIVDEIARSGHASKTGRTGRADAHRTSEPDTPVDVDRNWRPTVRSKIERTEAGARIWASSEQEAERLRDRLVKQLAAEGLQIESQELRRSAFNDVTVQISIDGVAWLRAAAKMTLAALSLALDDDWLDSADAKRLRGWLWDADPELDDGSPAFTYPVQPHAAEALVAEPPAHLISLMPILGTSGRILISIGLFGVHYLRVAVDTPLPCPEDCWLMAPGNPPLSMTWPELVNNATLRLIQQQGQNQPPRSETGER